MANIPQWIIFGGLAVPVGSGSGLSVAGSGLWHSTSSILDPDAYIGSVYGQSVFVNTGVTDTSWASYGGDIAFESISGSTASFEVTGLLTKPLAALPGTLSALTYNGSVFAWSSFTGTITWANDLATSSLTNQYVSGISGGNGTGGTVTLSDGVHSLTLAGTTATTLQTTGAALTLQTLTSGTLSVLSASALTLTAASASTWSTSSGALTIDSAAALNLGTTNATSVTVGSSGNTATLTLNVTAGGTFSVARGGTARITVAANTTIDSAGAINLGASTATSVVVGNATNTTAITDTVTSGGTWSAVVGSNTNISVASTTIGIGRSGVTTTITGALTQLTGAFSLTGNGASGIATSAGALTITSAAAATWSTAAGALTVSGFAGINAQKNGVTYVDVGVTTGSTVTLAAGISLAGATGAGALSLGSMLGDTSLPTGNLSWAGASTKTLSLVGSGASATATIDAGAAALSLGNTNATSVVIGNVTNTTTISHTVTSSGKVTAVVGATTAMTLGLASGDLILMGTVQSSYKPGGLVIGSAYTGVTGISQTSTASTSGQTMTIAAQGATGAAHNGAALVLTGGTSGSATAGGVQLQLGGATLIDVGVTATTAVTLAANINFVGATGTGALTLGSMAGATTMPTGSWSWAGASAATYSAVSTAATWTGGSVTSGTTTLDSGGALDLGNTTATSVIVGNQANTAGVTVNVKSANAFTVNIGANANISLQATTSDQITIGSATGTAGCVYTNHSITYGSTCAAQVITQTIQATDLGAHSMTLHAQDACATATTNTQGANLLLGSGAASAVPNFSGGAQGAVRIQLGAVTSGTMLDACNLSTDATGATSRRAVGLCGLAATTSANVPTGDGCLWIGNATVNPSSNGTGGTTVWSSGSQLWVTKGFAVQAAGVTHFDVDVTVGSTITLGAATSLAWAGTGSVTGSLVSGGAFTITAGAASTWKSAVGALTVDSAAALNLGSSTATSVVIGNTSNTTVITCNAGLGGTTGGLLLNTLTSATATGTISVSAGITRVVLTGGALSANLTVALPNAVGMWVINTDGITLNGHSLIISSGTATATFTTLFVASKSVIIADSAGGNTLGICAPGTWT